MKITTIASCTAIAAALLVAQGVRAADDDAAVTAEAEQGGAEIIVTGTRAYGVTAAASATPLKVIGSDALERVGQPNLNQALTQLVPSFTAEAFGGDTANLTLSARLRGLSPNHALVLINGKRRHGTANLHVLGGPFQGGASPDIDLIPAAAIARIEVLQEGAAAQYGSDAIAGVINIILKSDNSGGSASVTGGSYYEGDGDTFAQSANLAVPIGDNGFFDVTVFHRFHDFSQRGGADRRLVATDGTPLPGVPASWQTIPGYPNLNRIVGDAKSYLTTGFYNAGYDFGDVELYSFGSYGRRVAKAYENYRLPSRVANASGMLFRPEGFSPLEGLVEDDYAFTGGIKGEISGWKWDLSGTYGKDKNKISTLNSANASLYFDTGFTPTDFYDGSFIATQFTGNLDINREVEIGFAKPLNVALGGEYRRDTYEITPGDAASIYKEGGQSYPGFQPGDAGKHSRRAWSAYIDLSANPVEEWTIDVAGRYEHYSDFGSTTIGKLTSRYDFSPAFALRGTVSTGFRAPTLAESFYSATNVSPSFAVVQLPANSASAALLGFQPLKPEKSTNFSLGFVTRPASRLTITVDAYQIKVRNRIAATGTILGQVGATVVNQAVIDAIALHGNVLDPTVSFVGTSLFANGIDTRTRGVEFAANYPTDIGIGRIDWTLTANYNETKITKNRLGPTLFDVDAQSYLETASPKYKVILGALFTSGAFTLNLRQSLYGPTSAFLSPDATTFYKSKIKAAAITDLELSYKLVEGLEFAIGANNLFDKTPETTPVIPGTASPTSGGTITNGGNVYDSPYTFSPYGINGGYYYGRVTLNF